MLPCLMVNSVIGAELPQAPRPLTGFAVRFAEGFVVDLTWDSVDVSASGIVVERCWPQNQDLHCELAAALHPDARGLTYHVIQAWHFRVASFNAHGISPYSALSPVVGVAHVINTGDAAPLSAADSIPARSIVDVVGESRRCTSPQALIDEGLTLVATRESVDLYRGPAGECGTGGCPYSSYTVTAGCYEVLEIDLGLYSQAPYFGRPQDAGHGLRLTGSSGSACEGRMSVIESDAVVDAYDWFSCYDEHLPSLRPPFNPRGLQRPDVPRN